MQPKVLSYPSSFGPLLYSAEGVGCFECRLTYEWTQVRLHEIQSFGVARCVGGEGSQIEQFLFLCNLHGDVVNVNINKISTCQSSSQHRSLKYEDTQIHMHSNSLHDMPSKYNAWRAPY